MTPGRVMGLAVLLALIAGLVAVVTPQILPHPAPAALVAPTSAPTWTLGPTQTPAPFPAFSDWRAVYLHVDGRLHATSLNGKNDALGPALDGARNAQIATPGASISPDGRSLALIVGNRFVIGPLGPGSAVTGGFHTLSRQFLQAVWAPDSARLAVVEGGALLVLRAADLSLTAVPLAGGAGSGVLGWIDNGHVALLRYGATSGGGMRVISVALADGTERTLFESSQTPRDARFVLSPDGSSLLYAAAPEVSKGEQFAPFVEAIAMADGRVRTLPNISARLTGGLWSVAWRPGSMTLAATTTRAGTTGDTALYLLDVARDTATLVETTLPFALGWAPGGEALLMSVWDGTTAAGGPLTLVAVMPYAPAGTAREVTVAAAVAGPFFGFARTA